MRFLKSDLKKNPDKFSGLSLQIVEVTCLSLSQMGNQSLSHMDSLESITNLPSQAWYTTLDFEGHYGRRFD